MKWGSHCEIIGESAAGRTDCVRALRQLKLMQSRDKNVVRQSVKILLYQPLQDPGLLLEYREQCPTGTRTRPATRYFLRYPTRPDSSFENHRVAGKLTYQVLPEISGCKLFVNNPKYPELPESKKDTRKYPIVFFNTPTRPEPDPLPGIFSNTRPDPTRY